MAYNGPPPPPLVLTKNKPDLPFGMTQNQHTKIQKTATLLLGLKNIYMTDEERDILTNNLQSPRAAHIQLLANTVNEIMERENPILGGRRRRRRTRRNKRSTRRR